MMMKDNHRCKWCKQFCGKPWTSQTLTSLAGIVRELPEWLRNSPIWLDSTDELWEFGRVRWSLLMKFDDIGDINLMHASRWIKDDKGWSFGSKSFSWPHGSSCLILRLIPKTHINVILGGENRRSANVLLVFSTFRLFCIQHQTSNIKLHETSCQVCWSPCSAFWILLGLNWSYIRELSCQ